MPNFDFLRYLNSVIGDHCESSPQASKKSSAQIIKSSNRQLITHTYSTLVNNQLELFSLKFCSIKLSPSLIYSLRTRDHACYQSISHFITTHCYNLLRIIRILNP